MIKNTGIYIHIPFCQSKCNYCDFYSMPSNTQTIKEYTDELKKEIILKSRTHKDKTIDTVYIGGGTPSLINIKELEHLLFTLYKNFNCKIKECSIEVNPCSSQNISKYKDIGINRISIGVQSLNDEILKILGRRH
ncbi:MAG: radical SAM protein, partial [Bacillota bacterium]